MSFKSMALPFIRVLQYPNGIKIQKNGIGQY